MQEKRVPDASGLGNARRLRLAWADVIERSKPTHFVTLTTKDEVSAERFAKLTRLFLRSIAQPRRIHFVAAWALGPQQRGATHGHAALCLPVDVEHREVESLWRRTDAVCRIASSVTFEPDAGGGLYFTDHPLLDVDRVCPRVGECRRKSCLYPLDLGSLDRRSV